LYFRHLELIGHPSIGLRQPPNAKVDNPISCASKWPVLARPRLAGFARPMTIHATKHPLGFAIMKDVMWRRGHSEYHAGGLELAQASRTNFIPLFGDRGDEAKGDILGALHSPLKVEVFCKDWVWRPDDTLCETAYKKALLELESTGEIEILSKDGKNPAPASSRQKRNGKPTLANDYYVRLGQKPKH
jgi:hypothetical protein